jgi:predicted nucleic-acid-binding protein
MRLLDANVVLRYLVDEDSEQSRRSYEFLQKVATGEEQVFLPECVVSEIVYVLESPKLYRLSRSDVAQRLATILQLEGVRMPQREAYLNALHIYQGTKADLEDCVSVALMRQFGIDEIVSFDRHFDQFPEIRRIEP